MAEMMNNECDQEPILPYPRSIQNVGGRAEEQIPVIVVFLVVTIQVIDRRALMGELNTASVEEPPESVAFRRSLLKA